MNLLKFDANKSGDRSSILNWSTANEVGTSHFVIQRSEDGVNWMEIGHVDAAGNSTDVRNYSFVDRNVYDGRRPSAKYLYRLLIVDLDGKGGYSNIDAVRFSSDGSKGSVYVYPNPSSVGLNVEFDFTAEDAKPASMEIFNTMGQLIFSRDIDEQTEFEYIHYATSNIPVGSFFLRISDEEGVPLAEEKIIVTR